MLNDEAIHKSSMSRSIHAKATRQPFVVSSKVISIAIVPLFVISQFIRSVLPDKYFYDSTSILNMVNGDTQEYLQRDSTYRATADFYRVINVLGFDTLQQWSIALSIIGCLMLMPIVLRLPNLSFLDTLLCLTYIALLNIYVFSISKDMIQFIVFYCIAAILNMSNRRPVLAASSAFLLLIAEAIFYRSYYLLVAIVFILVVLMLLKIRSKGGKTKSTLRAGFWFIFEVVLIVLVMLVSMKVIAPNLYDQLVNVRNETGLPRVGSTDAQTVIINLFPGDGIFVSLVNWFVNGLRMMFPIELIFKGKSYILFIVFQLLVVRLYVRNLGDYGGSVRSARFFGFCLFTAYLAVSFFFEPDFGSWARHEAAVFPILQLLLFNSSAGRSESVA